MPACFQGAGPELATVFFSVLAVVNWQVARKRRPTYTSARFFALPVGSPLS